MKNHYLIFCLLFVFAASCAARFETDEDAADDADELETGDMQVDEEEDGEIEDADGMDGDVEEGDISPLCGNGEQDDGEECDDANDENGDGCDNDCTWSCHNDGECNDGDACNGEETCDMDDHVCIDGHAREDGFVCESDPRSICLESECRESECGDRFVDTGGGEFCEPPNEDDCNADCQWSCRVNDDCENDGNPCNGEEYCEIDVHLCDHRNAPSGGTVCGEEPRRICIEQTCQESMCGDGYVDTGGDEECEDGNLEEGDGCDNDCTFSCHGNDECMDTLECNEDVCNPDVHVCQHPLLEEGTVCRESGGDCDQEERCNGTHAGCPENMLRPETHICRLPEGGCDVLEYCTGDGPDCPDNELFPETHVCREVDGNCDVEELCPGDNPLCPDDEFLPGTTVCREIVDGGCDIAENCTGEGPNCPEDEFQPSSFLCRPATTGGCDLPEFCPGRDVSCPDDSFRSDTFVCRESEGTCDIAELCPGSGPDCPGDAYIPAGESCSDGDYCTIDDTCQEDFSCLGAHEDSLHGIRQIAAGAEFTCALLDPDGDTIGGLKCWGANSWGMLGDGTISVSFEPVDVIGLSSGVVAVAAGRQHTCAVLVTGGVKCWGNNNSGQLGVGSETEYSLEPVDVAGLSATVKYIDTMNDHTCVVLADRSVQCWGDNAYGQCGDGTVATPKWTPVTVGLSVEAVRVSTGGFHTCVYTTDDTVQCWGRNDSSQCGDGTTDSPKLSPLTVGGLVQPFSVSAGGEHTCARVGLNGRNVLCWGKNIDGQCGDGTLDSPKTAPVTVIDSGGSGLTTVDGLQAGGVHNCIITTTGTAMCWGDNAFGQCGNGVHYANEPYAVFVLGLGGWVASMGTSFLYHTVAVLDTHYAQGWGENDYSQTGVGYSSMDILMPANVICDLE